MGKGSAPRPIEIPRDQYRNNYDAIFGNKKPEPAPTNGGTAPPAK